MRNLGLIERRNVTRKHETFAVKSLVALKIPLDISTLFGVKVLSLCVSHGKKNGVNW